MPYPSAELVPPVLDDLPQVVGARVLVALSGGPDSVALLHLLADPALRLELESAHVHHGHRGAEADADAAFCAQLCARLGVPFHLLRLDPLDRPALGREAAWRLLRYRALLDLAHRRAIPFVATGHHRDDVAEGVLMQLLRGGGPRAMAGVERVTASGLIRPLLRLDRQTIMSWLEARGIPWRDDRSNLDLSHPRNVVRHRLLPALEGAFPAARGHLVALAGALADDEAFLASELARRAQWADPWSPNGGVPVAAVAELPRALRSRWLLEQVERLGLGRATRRQLELLHRLLDTGSPRAVPLPRRWRLYRSAGSLWAEPPQPPAPFALELAGADRWTLPLPGWSARLVQAAATGSWCCPVPRGGRLVLRSPREGDMVGDGDRQRRLHGLLRRRLPRHLRRAWPVLVVDGRIMWVPGVWQTPTAEETASLVVEVSRT